MAITQVISTLPPAGSITEPATFDDREEAFMLALDNMPAELTAWAGQANASAAAAGSAADAAQVSAITAREATDAVLSQGDAPAAWSALTTYALYDAAIGSNGRAYRSLQAGNLSHDPTDLSGAWWLELNPDPRLAALLLLGDGLFPDWAMQSQGPAGTYPPADPWQPACVVWVRGVERYRVNYTWGTAGGLTGVPLTVALEYSSNSGASYAAVTTAATFSYATGASLIGVTWAPEPLYEPLLAFGGEALLTAGGDPLLVEV